MVRTVAGKDLLSIKGPVVINVLGATSPTTLVSEIGLAILGVAEGLAARNVVAATMAMEAFGRRTYALLGTLVEIVPQRLTAISRAAISITLPEKGSERPSDDLEVREMALVLVALAMVAVDVSLDTSSFMLVEIAKIYAPNGASRKGRQAVEQKATLGRMWRWNLDFRSKCPS